MNLIRLGQESYSRIRHRKLVPRGGTVWFTREHRKDRDRDFAVYWCVSTWINEVCLTEEDAVALRDQLPQAVIGGSYTTNDELLDQVIAAEGGKP